MNDMSVTRLKILSLLSDISTNDRPQLDRIAVLRVHKNKTHFFIRLKGGIGIRGGYMCYIQTGLYRYKQFTFCNINDLQIKKAYRKFMDDYL